MASTTDTPKKNSDGELLKKAERHCKSNGQLLKNLKDTLSRVKNRNKHIVICHDFNYNLLTHEFNAHITYAIFLFTTVYH